MDSIIEPEPAAELTAGQQKRTRNLAIITSILMITSMACLGGNVLTLAVIKLGAQERFIGLLSFAVSIPFMASALTISTMERIGKRKLLLIWHFVALILVTPIIFIPSAVHSYDRRSVLILLLVCTLLWRSAVCMGNTGWFPILQDSIPPEMTGRFFGRLRTYWQSVWLILLIAMAWFLNDNDPGWWKFQVIFITGFAAMVAKLFFIAYMSEAPVEKKKDPPKKMFHRFKELLSEKPLRTLVLYSISYFVIFTIAEPFKVKLLKDLGFTDSFIMVAIAMVGAGAIVSLRFWGKLADRFGNRGVFSVSHIGMIVTTLLWLLVEKNSFGRGLVLVLYFLMSVFNGANGIARTRYILHAVPSKKQYYINIIDILCNSSMAIGPLIGGFFLYCTKGFLFTSGALSLNNYHLLFIITAVLFVIPHLLRKNLRGKKETPTTQVLNIVTRPIRNAFGSFIKINRAKQDK